MEATVSRMILVPPTWLPKLGAHSSAAAKVLGKPCVRSRKLAVAATGITNSREFSARLVASVKAEATGNPMEGRSAEEDDDGGLREECGVAGVYGDTEAGRLCYLALHALQHRGQEGAGIVSADNSALKAVTGLGLVSEVFDEDNICKAGRVEQACKLADGIIDRGREIPGKVCSIFINTLQKAGKVDLALKLLHSRIGIGYNMFRRVKQRVKFRTLLEPNT